MPPLPPSLDDRRFQDIVDQAKRMIPRYCPDWTDHNVSDPGVTLIELFAWMTDMLLYRVNQIPDRMYVEFLNLIGFRLEPPRAARAPVTFYLSAALATDVTIPEGTEVSTVRTGTTDAITFTTEADLTIRPPTVLRAFTQRPGPEGVGRWIAHDLNQLGLPNRRIALFPSDPAPGDAFYLSLEKDHSYHVLAVVLDCETAAGAGVDPRTPPIEWQVYQGGANPWADCEVEFDGTGGFNWSGEVLLHVPPTVRCELQGTQSYWLRCRLTAAQATENPYRISPDLRGVRVEARGGTAVARHAVTVLGEQLGTSDGTPGQRFRLRNTPVLARDRVRDFLIVEPSADEPERWNEVADFGDGGPSDRHFTLDSREGTLTLGPALLQPDGSVYHFGEVPPRDSVLRFNRYQFGGGIAGNLPRSTLSVLKTSIPYVSRVINRAPAVGGLDGQGLDDARMRAPFFLRTRTRAVTADDYEYLSTQVPGVARACCIAPEAQPGEPNDPSPGQVIVVVLPHVDSPHGRIPPDALVPSTDLRGATLAYLNERRLLGTALQVRAPEYVWVSVQARVRVSPRVDPAAAVEAGRRAEAELYRYLNPVVGGPNATGWPFGRGLYSSEIYSLLQRVPMVEFVEDVQIAVVQPGSTGAPRPVSQRLVLPRGGLVCSHQHQVAVAR